MEVLKLAEISEELKENADVLAAIGDETRLHILGEMLKAALSHGECKGIRVGEICEITHLSRPAVSHHMRCLKQAGVIKVRKDGAKNYYYIDAETRLRRLNAFLQHVLEFFEENEKEV